MRRIAVLVCVLIGASVSLAQTKPAEELTGNVARGQDVILQADVRGKSADAGGVAEYAVRVINPTSQPTKVQLAFEPGFLTAMTPNVEPAAFDLAPGESKPATVRVTVPQRIPPGGHESQRLRAVANDSRWPATMEFVTAARLPHPYIIHTAAGWDEVRAKVEKYDWAKKSKDDYVARAEKWNVPNVQNPKNPQRGDWLFRTEVENSLMDAGIAYQLTSDKKFAEKVRTFLMRLSDPSNGFPVTRRGCNQASVQEGHFFQHIAMAYDMALPSGVFSDADRQQIDTTLRLFCGTDADAAGQISNWNVSSLCGGLYCALDLQDLATANLYLHKPGAIIDQLRNGTLDDGWWYELSISYNTWVASEFSQMALAMRAWGIDLANTSFTNGYRPDKQRIPQQSDYGATDAKWGPINHNDITIKRMWDVLPKMVDYRGVMFGLNDSAEARVAGFRGEVGAQPLEIAYFLYRDPAYATIIKHSGTGRDLIYGVPELPENTPDRSAASTYADNAGVAVLRSRAAGKPDRERIQAVLTYGDHGWYHGHFDTASLGHLSRYGRSFFNPEMIWYGYGSYLYKFYVQTSVSKNMVVVDQKQQEPTENQRILFHAGDLMQASAVQVRARWSNPPYGGIVYDEKQSFAEKMLQERRSIPIPPNPPPYAKIGSLTSYTEPVLQRRLMVVTDDYVVLADYMQGEREHTYDSLFQMKSFQSLEGADKQLVRHTGQWDANPVSSAQFVTDCDWYEVTAPARGSYQFRWGEGADNPGTNEPGVLNLDVYTLWPARQEIMIGTPPEVHPVERMVTYAVRSGDKVLAEGKSGVWILGQQNIDVALGDVTSLELQTQCDVTRPATLFWAGGVIVTKDGKEIPLAQLPLSFENTQQPKEKGKDFAGGPIKVAGVEASEAVSAQPQDGKRPAIVRVDLHGVQAARFKCVLGGDYPLGDERQRRKTVAVRSVGKTATFLTVIEPFEQQRVVKSAQAINGDTVRVELIDGRTQDIAIKNLDGQGTDLSVSMVESRDGKTLRSESTR